MSTSVLLRWLVFASTFLGSIWAGSALDLPLLSYCSPIFAAGAAGAFELVASVRQRKGLQARNTFAALTLLPLLLVILDQSVKYLTLLPLARHFGQFQSLAPFLPNFGSLYVVDVQRNFSIVAAGVFSIIFVLFAFIHRNWAIVVGMGLILGGGVSNGLDFVFYGRAIVMSPLSNFGIGIHANLADISIYVGLAFFAAGAILELRKSLRHHKGD
jgi:lipoprotein signal peptidase